MPTSTLSHTLHQSNKSAPLSSPTSYYRLSLPSMFGTQKAILNPFYKTPSNILSHSPLGHSLAKPHPPWAIPCTSQTSQLHCQALCHTGCHHYQACLENHFKPPWNIIINWLSSFAIIFTYIHTSYLWLTTWNSIMMYSIQLHTTQLLYPLHNPHSLLYLKYPALYLPFYINSPHHLAFLHLSPWDIYPTCSLINMA